jgi:D-alanyl-D-alanine dipeptidase
MTHLFFGPLEPLRQQPIPDLAEAWRKRVGYRAHALDASHPLYDEPLVDLTTLGIDGMAHYARPDNPPYYEVFPGAIPHLLLRHSVALRLQAIDQALRAQGLKLFVHDAYRPRAIQVHGHEIWMPRQLRAQHPEWDAAQVLAEASKYWAAPTSDPASPAPHSTGGAVDLTLAGVASGQALYMGSIFDDVTGLAHTDYYESHQDGSYSAVEAQANRRLLYWLLTAAGFANTPQEWWHFTWGDQFWARLTGQLAAHYGEATPDIRGQISEVRNSSDL